MNLRPLVSQAVQSCFQLVSSSFKTRFGERKTNNDKAGPSCASDELAAWMGSPHLVARSRLGAARMFGLTADACQQVGTFANVTKPPMLVFNLANTRELRKSLALGRGSCEGGRVGKVEATGAWRERPFA